MASSPLMPRTSMSCLKFSFFSYMLSCVCLLTKVAAWFRAASEFVDEQKTGATASFHHVFHVEQMAGIGAQVVLYALLVPDIDKDTAENAGA